MKLRYLTPPRYALATQDAGVWHCGLAGPIALRGAELSRCFYYYNSRTPDKNKNGGRVRSSEPAHSDRSRRPFSAGTGDSIALTARPPVSPRRRAFFAALAPHIQHWCGPTLVWANIDVGAPCAARTMPSLTAKYIETIHNPCDRGFLRLAIQHARRPYAGGLRDHRRRMQRRHDLRLRSLQSGHRHRHVPGAAASRDGQRARCDCKSIVALQGIRCAIHRQCIRVERACQTDVAYWRDGLARQAEWRLPDLEDLLASRATKRSTAAPDATAAPSTEFRADCAAGRTALGAPKGAGNGIDPYTGPKMPMLQKCHSKPESIRNLHFLVDVNLHPS